MEQKGWVESSQMKEDGTFAAVTNEDRESDLAVYETWLPTAESGELSVDEIGLWHQITEAGREAWKTHFNSNEPNTTSDWMIDDLREANRLIIHAQDTRLADRRLEWWLKEHPEIELEKESRTTEPINEFTPRNGTPVQNGVVITYRYSVRPVNV
jgi:hypothetical protein